MNPCEVTVHAQKKKKKKKGRKRIREETRNPNGTSVSNKTEIKKAKRKYLIVKRQQTFTQNFTQLF